MHELVACLHTMYNAEKGGTEVEGVGKHENTMRTLPDN